MFDCVLNTPLSLDVNEVRFDEEPISLIRIKNRQKIKVIKCGESDKSGGLRGNVSYVGAYVAWVAWVKFLRGLRELRGSKYFLRGSAFYVGHNFYVGCVG